MESTPAKANLNISFIIKLIWSYLLLAKLYLVFQQSKGLEFCKNNISAHLFLPHHYNFSL
jgi:hypothetical protein